MCKGPGAERGGGEVRDAGLPVRGVLAGPESSASSPRRSSCTATEDKFFSLKLFLNSGFIA